MTLHNGGFYRNFRGDTLGPMEERVPGHPYFLDQYGTLYHPDGTQLNHVQGSTGNIDLSTFTDSSALEAALAVHEVRS